MERIARAKLFATAVSDIADRSKFESIAAELQFASARFVTSTHSELHA